MQTFKVAARLRQQGMSELKAFELMAEHYNVPSTCEPLWTAEELQTKVHNAYAYASMNAPGEYTTEGQEHPQVQAKAAAQAKAEFAADPLPGNSIPARSKIKIELTPEERENIIRRMRLLVDQIKDNTAGEAAENVRTAAAEMLSEMMGKYGISFADMGLADNGSDPKDNTSGPVPPNWKHISPWHTSKLNGRGSCSSVSLSAARRGRLTGGRYILDKESFDSKFDHVQSAAAAGAKDVGLHFQTAAGRYSRKYESFCFMPGAPERLSRQPQYIRAFGHRAKGRRHRHSGMIISRYLFPDNARRGHLLGLAGVGLSKPEQDIRNMPSDPRPVARDRQIFDRSGPAQAAERCRMGDVDL